MKTELIKLIDEMIDDISSIIDHGHMNEDEFNAHSKHRDNLYILHEHINTTLKKG